MDGRVVDTTTSFARSTGTGRGGERLELHATTIYPRPYPIQAVEDPTTGTRIEPELISDLPGGGYEIATFTGSIFIWIERDVLYTLIAEVGQDLRPGGVIPHLAEIRN